MSNLLLDLRYALRALRKNPGFTLVAVLTLTLGLGANTTIFSLINAVLLRPPPHVADPGRLVAVFTSDFSGPAYGTSAWPDYLDFRAGNQELSGLAAFTPQPVNVATGAETFHSFGAFVSANYFDVLGVLPVRGRTFRPEEEQSGTAPTVVIGYGLWQQRLGSDSGVIGRTIHLSGHPFTVIGVAPPGFAGTISGIGLSLWIPYPQEDLFDPGRQALTDRGSRSLMLVGRMRPAATLASVRARFRVIARQEQAAYPQWWTDVHHDARRITVISQREAGVLPRIRGAVVGFFGILATVAGLVLLICCANLANLLLARGAGRTREIALRLALGAGRLRIARQLLIESTLLSVLGGIGGVLLASSAGRLLTRLQPPVPVPIVINASPDGRVLVYAAVITLLTGVLFGVLPALTASRAGTAQGLRDAPAATGRVRRRLTLRNALVVGQVAISAVLLVMAGLFLQSLRRAQSMDLGFQPDHLALVTLDLESQGYDGDRAMRFLDDIEQRARSLPGVVSATMARNTPLGLDQMRRGFQVEDYHPGPTEDMEVGTNMVDDDYFATLGIALLQGRGFTPQDREGSPLVAVVNRAFVQRYWPDGDALGRHVNAGHGPAEVVGVVANARVRSIRGEAEPYLYLPRHQSPIASAVLEVQTAGDPSAMLPTLRQMVATFDADLPVQVGTMREDLGLAMLPQRAGAVLLGALGGLGMLLAALGLYGVLAYLVARRTREIGIRMALGSEAGAVMRLVLRQAASLTAIGLAIGLALALLAGRLTGSFLFGVTATDPETFGAVLVVFLLVALVAGFAPARRATRVDPLEALRVE